VPSARKGLGGHPCRQMRKWSVQHGGIDSFVETDPMRGGCETPRHEGGAGCSNHIVAGPRQPLAVAIGNPGEPTDTENLSRINEPA
jgi:hypothetical protein